MGNHYKPGLSNENDIINISFVFVKPCYIIQICHTIHYEASVYVKKLLFSIYVIILTILLKDLITFTSRKEKIIFFPSGLLMYTLFIVASFKSGINVKIR